MSTGDTNAVAVRSSNWICEPRTRAALPPRNGVGGGSGASQKESFTFFEIVLALFQIAGILPTCKTNSSPPPKSAIWSPLGSPVTKPKTPPPSAALFGCSDFQSLNGAKWSARRGRRSERAGRKEGRRGAKAPRGRMGDALAQDRAGATGRVECPQGRAWNFRTSVAREVPSVAEAGEVRLTTRSGAGSQIDQAHLSAPGGRVERNQKEQ